MALDVSSNLSANYKRLSKSTERLSTGLRVNSASDDAAGLGIRELMRADIAALRQGARNANDAISLLMVADGALGVIDEKLIRMKELAEQAATGTYDSTQRLMIASEFQAMAAEIDRIARATDFNGIHLLDGSLSGEHDGSGLIAKGALKIHFGSGNDSAEDYYCARIGDCTAAGLGLVETVVIGGGNVGIEGNPNHAVGVNPYLTAGIRVNNFLSGQNIKVNERDPRPMRDLFVNGVAYIPVENSGKGINNFMMLIPKGAKNIMINTLGVTGVGPTQTGDNDIALFTLDGIHLAGTPLDDLSYDKTAWPKDAQKFGSPTDIDSNSAGLGFTSAEYNGSILNTGNPAFDPTGETLNYTRYNGMLIGYSGDPERFDAKPNDGLLQTWQDYEILTIDEATEDLILWMPGQASTYIKTYWDLTPDPAAVLPDVPESVLGELATTAAPLNIETQEKAQKALVTIDDAIARKDKIRANLGALQNRLENTVTNIIGQSENLMAAESRISDANIAEETAQFVRNQILTQSSVAMLSQANTYPHMLMSLLG